MLLKGIKIDNKNWRDISMFLERKTKYYNSIFSPQLNQIYPLKSKPISEGRNLKE